MNSFEVEFAQLKEEERVLAGRNKNEAFTLIELLVVIAIIAILAAILFPVFAQAKEAAKQANDISNVKQIVLSELMYNGDYDDTYPLLSDAGEEYIVAMNLQPYVKNEQIFTSPKVTVSGGTTQQRWTDLLPDPNYQTDPALLGVASTGSDLDMWPDVYPACDYQINSNFATMGTEVDGFNSVGAGTIPEPASAARWLNFVAVAEDFDTSGPARDLSYLSGGMATAYNETLGTSKEGKRTVGFADGHAKVYPTSTLWPSTNFTVPGGGGAPGNGGYPNWGVSPQFSERGGIAYGTKG